jgi:hypothetical protein
MAFGFSVVLGCAARAPAGLLGTSDLALAGGMSSVGPLQQTVAKAVVNAATQSAH